MSIRHSLLKFIVPSINYSFKSNIVNKNRMLCSNLRENKIYEKSKQTANKQRNSQTNINKMFISGTLNYDITNEDDYLTIQSIKHSYDNTIEYDVINKRFYMK